ncbi:hypothetical protein ACWOFR_17025 [Carnobacterium gallinarum]|nr:hypothetical protein [Carnobacterium gallinarum]
MTVLVRKQERIEPVEGFGAIQQVSPSLVFIRLISEGDDYL